MPTSYTTSWDLTLVSQRGLGIAAQALTQVCADGVEPSRSSASASVSAASDPFSLVTARLRATAW